MKTKFAVILMLTAFLGCGGSSSSPMPEVTFDFSDAQALILHESSPSSEAGYSLAKTTTQEAITNLKKLISDGTLANVIYTAETDEGQTTETAPITVDDIKIAPWGDIYVLFGYRGVALTGWVQGSSCYLVVVTPPDQASCVEDYAGDFSNVKFDSQGNTYYIAGGIFEGAYWSPAAIGKRTRNGVISTVFSMLAIHFYCSDFVVAPDGSLFVEGDLQGSSDHLFRYFPNTGRLEPLDNDLQESASLSNLLENGKFYHPYAGTIYVGTFAEDSSLSFQPIFSSGEFGVEIYEGTSFTMTSAGEVYMVGGESVVRIEPSFAQVDLPDFDIEFFKTSGEFIYLTGTDPSSGKYVFIRKDLSVEGEETDLLGGRNLLVQQFDVAGSGDIYFGALDLDTTTVYLFKYNNEKALLGEDPLEQLESLPGDLTDIIMM